MPTLRRMNRGVIVPMPDWLQRVFASGPSEEELRGKLAALQEKTPLPVFWLFGKTQTGKTSIIKFLTGANDAEIGAGFKPTTRFSRQVGPGRADGEGELLVPVGLGRVPRDGPGLGPRTRVFGAGPPTGRPRQQRGGRPEEPSPIQPADTLASHGHPPVPRSRP